MKTDLWFKRLGNPDCNYNQPVTTMSSNFGLLNQYIDNQTSSTCLKRVTKIINASRKKLHDNKIFDYGLISSLLLYIDY